MPDICMCSGRREVDGNEVRCPKMGTCYRHTAKPTPDRQSWFMAAPFWPGGDCDYYVPVTASLVNGGEK